MIVVKTALSQWLPDREREREEGREKKREGPEGERLGVNTGAMAYLGKHPSW